MSYTEQYESEQNTKDEINFEEGCVKKSGNNINRLDLDEEECVYEIEDEEELDFHR